MRYIAKPMGVVGSMRIKSPVGQQKPWGSGNQLMTPLAMPANPVMTAHTNTATFRGGRWMVMGTIGVMVVNLDAMFPLI